jgi:hypothetical protein
MKPKGGGLYLGECNMSKMNLNTRCRFRITAKLVKPCMSPALHNICHRSLQGSLCVHVQSVSLKLIKKSCSLLLSYTDCQFSAKYLNTCLTSCMTIT